MVRASGAVSAVPAVAVAAAGEGTPAAEPVAPERAGTAEPVVALGARLKRVRQQAGLSLREVARQLGVSPSFVSQLENGKSQPSVATLYSISQLLDVSIDQLFALDGPGARSVPTTTMPEEVPGAPISRSDLGSPADAWRSEQVLARLSVTRPGERVRLEMDSGVVWEQLATNTGRGLDFLEIVYPPHSTSTNDNRMLRHAGSEFGYLIEGQLEITVGFEVFTLRAGEAVGFDSSMPHLLSNRADVAARGIWFVQHPHS